MSNFPSGTRQWALDSSSSSFSSSSSSSNQPFVFTPAPILVRVLLIFSIVRWATLMIRGLGLSCDCVKVRSCSEHLTFLFFYLCSTAACLAALGVELTDCVEWWAVGGTPQQLLIWQIAYYSINAFFMITLLLAVTCRCVRTYRQPSQSRPLTVRPSRTPQGLRRSWRESYDSSSPAQVTKIFLFGSSFIGSCPVLLFGLNKPWVIAIWSVVVLTTLDFVMNSVLTYGGFGTGSTLPSNVRRNENPGQTNGNPSMGHSYGAPWASRPLEVNNHGNTHVLCVD
eukprot:Selendium_serpulae@DN8326_c0_g1_i1.p1